jgi:protein-S-isoprenylcysteine O-methyltransferase Ste14
MKYLMLAAAWTAWCAIHSLLISMRVTAGLKEKLGDRYRFFRLFFNILSALTLLPVLVFSQNLASEPLLSWAGWWRALQVMMLTTSIWLFAAGARKYDMPQFLGVRQIVEHESAQGITRTGGLDTSGILGLVRHPWYTGAILLLWARDLDTASLTANLVLTAYLIIGTLLEERKLVAEFGAEYLQYREQVSMLIPFFRKSRTPRD